MTDDPMIEGSLLTFNALIDAPMTDDPMIDESFVAFNMQQMEIKPSTATAFTVRSCM